MDKMTSVSIRASRSYVEALGQIAKRRNKKIGDLVRECLDKEFGQEITPLSSFFEQVVKEVGRFSTNVDGQS